MTRDLLEQWYDNRWDDDGNEITELDTMLLMSERKHLARLLDPSITPLVEAARATEHNLPVENLNPSLGNDFIVSGPVMDALWAAVHAYDAGDHEDDEDDDA